MIRRIREWLTGNWQWPVQREYRQYLRGLDHAAPQRAPYVLSSVKEITEERARELRQELVRQHLEARRNAPIVGVTMGLSESEQRALYGDR
jgi:hypothetical protein